MPHKHTRRKGRDDSNFNLAPSTIAKPLPTYTHLNLSQAKKKNHPNPPKRKKQNHEDNNSYKQNDTPRAFTRLMHLQTSNKKRPRSGLDDGDASLASNNKKRKLHQTSLTTTPPDEQPEIPTILPGERLADFAARVDQALPVSGGLKRKGVREKRQTRMEKKMQSMYAAWREEHARLEEKNLAEQEQELAEDAEGEVDDGAEVDDGRFGLGFGFPAGSSNRSGKKRGGKDEEGDIWAGLKATREEEKRRGLHDVVQAPPKFTVKPREKFKVRKNGAEVEVENVPSAAGSLRRREELGRVRRGVIEGYRGLMRRRRRGSWS